MYKFVKSCRSLCRWQLKSFHMKEILWWDNVTYLHYIFGIQTSSHRVPLIHFHHFFALDLSNLEGLFGIDGRSLRVIAGLDYVSFAQHKGLTLHLLLLVCLFKYGLRGEGIGDWVCGLALYCSLIGKDCCWMFATLLLDWCLRRKHWFLLCDICLSSSLRTIAHGYCLESFTAVLLRCLSQTHGTTCIERKLGTRHPWCIFLHLLHIAQIPFTAPSHHVLLLLSTWSNPVDFIKSISILLRIQFIWCDLKICFLLVNAHIAMDSTWSKRIILLCTVV